MMELSGEAPVPLVGPRDLDHVRVGLRHARGDGADAGRGHQLHGDLGVRADVVQIVDELREVLDAVDVVVGRRRDELDARDAVAERGDVGGHLGPRQLPALPGLRPLRELDLQLLGADQVLRRHAEPPRRELLGLGVPEITVAEPLEVREGRRVAALVHVR